MDVVHMKQKARSYFWWAELNKEIEKIIKLCENCLTLKDLPPKIEIIPWS